MPRLTLDQIRQMTPDFGGMLQSMGLSVGGENEDGSLRYIDSEGNWVAPDVVNSMVSGSELGGFQNEFLRDQGVIDASMLTDVSELNKQAGLNLQNPDDYWKYIYGGGDRVGDYWVLPEGQRYDQYQNAPPSLSFYDSADKFGALTKALVLGGITAGMTGMLPGTESVFGAGGAGAGAGAEAAWGVNPATAGGEFGLSGGTAGNLAGTGGLSSSAGGVTGLTGAGGLGLTVPAASTAMGSTALLTPTMLASMGLPAANALGTSALTAAQQMGGVADTAWGVNAGGSALGNVLGGNGSAQDWASVLGTAGSSLLGVAGANNASQGYQDIANQFMQMGAPYREKLLQSYQPGFSMADQPDFQNALDIGAQAAARATSAKVGNPVDNPGAYSEMQKYISGSLALPQLNTYRSQLGSFGQLGTNTAGTAMGNQVQAEGGMYDAIGSGLASLTKPKNPYEDMFKGLMGGFKLNTGSYL